MKKIFTLCCVQFFMVFVYAQVPNSNFENWITDINGNLNPVSWETTNDTPIITVLQYSPACAGNYAMQVKPYDIGGFVLPGITFTNFAFTQRPTQFTACIKATIMPGDEAYVIFSSHRGDSDVEQDSIVAAADSCTFKIVASINQFQCITMPLAYLTTESPDSATIMVVAGSFNNTHMGTEIIIDNISFTCATGINETTPPVSAALGKSYPNPSAGTTFVPLSLISGSRVTLRVYNIIGEEIITSDKGFMSAGEHAMMVKTNDLADGIYTYTVKGTDFSLSGRFTVSK